jgi:predicted type IV restriction endonuclease
MDNKMIYLIEVKAIGLTLKEIHVQQAVNYGANKGIPWVVLTSGIDWEIHRIRFEQPIGSDLVCSFNFLELNLKKQEDKELLFLLCKEGISKDAITKFYERIQSVNRFVIGAIVPTDSVIDIIRKGLKRISPGIRVTNEQIENILVTEVLKREIVEGETATKAKNRVKKHLKN